MIKIQNINEIEYEETFEHLIIKEFLPIPIKTLSILIGRGGVGKSMIALQMAIHYIKENKKNVFLWLSEDSLKESKKRTSNICKYLKIDENEISKHLFISNSKPIEILNKINGNIFINKEFIEVKKQLKDFELIILDPLKSFALNLEENSNSEMDKLMKTITFWCKDEDKTLMIIHHSSKLGGSRGASSITDACRLAYEVLPTNIDNIKNIKIIKDNFNITGFLKTSQIKINIGEKNEQIYF